MSQSSHHKTHLFHATNDRRTRRLTTHGDTSSDSFKTALRKPQIRQIGNTESASTQARDRPSHLWILDRLLDPCVHRSWIRIPRERGRWMRLVARTSRWLDRPMALTRNYEMLSLTSFRHLQVLRRRIQRSTSADLRDFVPQGTSRLRFSLLLFTRSSL